LGFKCVRGKRGHWYEGKDLWKKNNKKQLERVRASSNCP